MDDPNSERSVLVGVERLDNVQQLVRTAGDLARLGGGRVRIVTVAVKRSDSPVSVLTDERIVREFAQESHELLDRIETPEGVTVERDVLVARSAAKGLLAAVEETDPVALVVGWREGSRTDVVFGTTVDRLVERAACDLYVERVGREADGVESVLLPVAGGPHVATAARAAVAIAARNDARLVVFSVDTAEDGDTTDFVAEARDAIAEIDGVPVETSVVSSDDVTDAVVTEAADHDVVVLGATRQGALRRRLAGSVPRQVVGGTERTVIVARNGDTVVGPLARLGGLLRR